MTTKDLAESLRRIADAFDAMPEAQYSHATPVLQGEQAVGAARLIFHLTDLLTLETDGTRYTREGLLDALMRVANDQAIFPAHVVRMLQAIER